VEPLRAYLAILLLLLSSFLGGCAGDDLPVQDPPAEPVAEDREVISSPSPKEDLPGSLLADYLKDGSWDEEHLAGWRPWAMQRGWDLAYAFDGKEEERLLAVRYQGIDGNDPQTGQLLFRRLNGQVFTQEVDLGDDELLPEQVVVSGDLAAVCYRKYSPGQDDGPVLGLFAWQDSSYQLLWSSPVSFWPNGGGSLEFASGLTQFTLTGYQPQSKDPRDHLFAPAGPDTRRLLTTTWALDNEGYVLKSTAVLDSPFNTLVETVYRASTGEAGEVLNFLASEAILPQALKLRQDPLGQEWALLVREIPERGREFSLAGGPLEGTRVTVEQGEDRPLVTAIEFPVEKEVDLTTPLGSAAYYLEEQGYTVGFEAGEMVIALENVWDNRAVVIYGPAQSEFNAELGLREIDGTWQVVYQKLRYFFYTSDYDDSLETLALDQGYDWGEEPGKDLVGMVNAGEDWIEFVVGPYGEAWEYLITMEQDQEGWRIKEKVPVPEDFQVKLNPD